MKKIIVISMFVASACSAERASGPASPNGPSNPPEPPVQPDTVPTRSSLGGQLAFVSNREGAAHIYLANPDGTGIRRLTREMQMESAPSWSPDGTRLAFIGDDVGTYVINSDGSGLTRIRNGGGTPSWSPDGKRLLVSINMGVRILPIDGSEQDATEIKFNEKGFTGPFAELVYPAFGARWSPDGRQIAFSAWIGWDFERVFISGIDGSNGRSFFPVKNVVWDECGPEWSPDGSRIAVLSMIYGISVVELGSGTSTAVATPGTTCWDEGNNLIAWSPDGLALAFTRRDPPWVPGPLPGAQKASIVIQDWATKNIRYVIPDAYDPAWSHPK